MAEPMFGGRKPTFGGTPANSQAPAPMFGGRKAAVQEEPTEERSGFQNFVENVSPLSPTNIGRGVKAAKAVIGGMSNAARNQTLNGGNVIIEGARKIGDAVEWATGDEDAGAVGETPQLQQMPKYVPEEGDMLDEGMTTLGEYGVGAVGGGMAAARLLPTAVNTVPKIARWLATLTASEAGGSSTIDADTETVLVGPNASFKGAQDMLTPLKGLTFDKDGNYDETLFEKRMNIMADSMLVGGIVGGAAGSVAKAGKFGWDAILAPVLFRNNTDYQRKAIVKGYLDIVSKVDGTETPEQLAAKRQQAIDYLNEHKEVMIQYGDDKVADASYKQDTLSALQDGFEGDAPHQARLEGLRAGARAGNSPNLEASIDKASGTLEEGLDQFSSTRGGIKAVDEAGNRITQRGQEVVDIERDMVDRGAERLSTAEQGIDEAIRNDPEFGVLLDRLGDKINIDFTSGTDRTSRSIIEKLRTVSTDMTETKNALYDAIPDDAPVNYESINALLQQPEIYRFLPDDVKEGLIRAGDNYKSLRLFSDTVLVDALTKAKQAGDMQTVVPAIRALRKNIDQDQLEWLAANGSPEVKETANAAKEYFKNEYAPFWRDGVLEDIQKVDRDLMMKPIKRDEKTRGILESTLDDPTAAPASNQVYDALETTGDQGLMGDYAMSKVGQEVQQVLNRTGKFTGEDITDITNKIGKWAPILERSGKKNHVETFLTKIREENFNVEKLQAELKALEKNYETVKDEVLGGYLSDFFKRQGGDYVPTSNNLKGFTKLFSDEENLDKLTRITAMVKNDPMAKEGMQAAYAKYLKSTLFNANRSSTGAAASNVDQLNKFLQEGSALAQFGDEIMGPEVMKGLRAAAQKNYNLNARSKARLDAAISDRSIGEQGTQGVNTMITWMFGVLNPTAARLRTVTSAMNKRLDPKQQVSAVIDSVLADPDLFARVAQDITDGGTRGLSHEHKRLLFRSMVRAGIYTDRDEEQFMSQEMNDDAMPEGPSVDDQTEDALQ